jgi:hypothetical protein
MKVTGHLVKWGMLGLFLAAISGLACTGSSISEKNVEQLEQQVKTRGLIVGFEGLQPFSGHRADNLTKKVAKDLDLAQAATSGNSSAYLPLVTSAHANGQSIYIVGYSLGGAEAMKLAEECRKEDIPVDILFLLDPVSTGKIPRNVRKVVFYQSGTRDSSVSDKPRGEFLEDPDNTQVKFEHESNLNHMDLPLHLADRIKAEIESGPDD